MPKSLLRWVLPLSLWTACSPEVEVYAPARELYAVYGVLNAQASEQFISITKVFQSEGDAILYAANNDLSARGMRVTLSVDSTVMQGQLVDVADTVPGGFSPRSTGVYKFVTAGATAIQPGKRYDLEITRPDHPEIHIQAWTLVPTMPVLTSPSPPIYSQQEQTFTLPTIDFNEDFLALFDKGNGIGFELRLYVRYWEGAKSKIGMWGPTAVFLEPKNCVANVSQGEMCYKIRKGSVPNALHSLFDQYHPDTVDVLDTIRLAYSLDSLSRDTWMEVTSVDSFLAYYMYANNPFGYGVNLLMDKQEFSNIGGGNTGIFGSINMSRRYLFLGPCTRWLAGLRGVKPPSCGD